MKIEWKQVFLYALAPALIAGFFSIVPKLYDIAVEPKAELTFSVTNGPEIQASNNFQKIVAITIKNSGKRYLTNIYAELRINNGIIKANKVYEATGLDPKISSSDNILKIELQKMHPDEQLLISALLISNQNNINPDFTLRSEEILGTIKKDSVVKKDNVLFSGVLPAASVFIVAILLLSTKSKTLAGTLANYKQDFLFYIPARLGLPEISKAMELVDSNLTYLRMADILLSHGLLHKERSKIITALKSLLLIKDMASISKEVVICNIKTLEGLQYNQSEIDDLMSKAISSGKIIEFRKLVDNLADNQHIQTDC